MKLPEYFHVYNIKMTHFAANHKMSRNTLYKFLNRGHHLTRDMAMKISKATKGVVTLSDLGHPEEKK